METGKDIIPIAILNIDYNRFKEDPLNNNLLELSNGKLRKASNTPFVQKKVFVTTPQKVKYFQIKSYLNHHSYLFKIQKWNYHQ